MSEQQSSERFHGILKNYFEAKGFGFIKLIDSNAARADVFLHASAVQKAGINGLQAGDRLSFVVEQAPRGPKATELRLEERAVVAATFGEPAWHRNLDA